MPWEESDAPRHTKKARSGKRKRQWSHIANGALKRGDSEGTAIRKANGVIRNGGKRKKKRRSSSR
jgi:uncharacterized protein YdaT